MFESLGAFAGGLGDGLRSGLDMSVRRQYAEGMKRSDAREAELHGAKVGRSNLNREKLARLQAANDEIAAAWRQDLDQPVPNHVSPLGLTSITKNRPVLAETRTAGLASPDGRASAASSDEMIGRRMLTGNLLEDVDELARIANIYKKHGLLEEMAPWMNKVYRAKKSGIPDALHSLLEGDARKARQILGNNGIRLATDPRRINTADQQELWKFRLEDGEEQAIDLRALASGFFPGSYLSRKILEK